MINPTSDFRPDWVSPPGDTIVDLMEERDWSQVELAQRLGYSSKHLSQLINGKAALTEDAALRLERVLGSTANFWLNREVKYREHLARLEAEERCSEWVGWLDQLPLSELKKAGVLAYPRLTKAIKPELVAKLLQFFGIASPDQWTARYAGMEVSFRRSRSRQSDVAAIASWLRLGEVAAEKQSMPKYSRAKFESNLQAMRPLTTLPPEEFEPRLRALCAEAGVSFVMVPAIPKAHVSGVARWLNAHRPLIQLSLYGKTNDKFWFTFFHEAAHILLHASEKKNIYLDDPNHGDQSTQQEHEANQWAGEFLIPASTESELPLLKSKGAVKAFAEKIELHPGIVVGRLQHDGHIEVTWMNELKVSFRFSDSH